MPIAKLPKQIKLLLYNFGSRNSDVYYIVLEACVYLFVMTMKSYDYYL